MKPVLISPLLISVLVLAGCGAWQRSSQDATLADLKPVRTELSDAPLPRVDLDELAAIYRSVLPLSNDEEIRRRVLTRLADIEMIRGEDSLAQGEQMHQLFDDAISAYEDVLQQYPQAANEDQLLYQLSKAHTLDGDMSSALAVLEQLSLAYPESMHTAEAEFRKGEAYFNEGRYRAAELSYARVIDAGAQGSWYNNALYMRAWSLFKQGHYRRSIRYFTEALDTLLASGEEPSALPRGEQELVFDSFRVLAVSFSYLEGPQTISRSFDQLGERHYEYSLYEYLGELYLSQQRYRDSAETFGTFASEYPNSEHAHRLQLRVIASYVEGGFPQHIVEEKTRYIDNYAVAGSYWLQSGPSVQQEIAGNLQLFIDELATHYHALAQEHARRDEYALAREKYVLSGDFYQRYIDMFPDANRVAEFGYLLAETRFEAGDYLASSNAYEWVAYQYPDYAKAGDAGYAAVVAYDRWLGVVPANEKNTLMRSKVDLQLRFAAVHAGDSRSGAVLSDAAWSLLVLEEYQTSVIAAATLLQREADVDQRLQAQLVLGHAHFALAQYYEAETAYGESLGFMPADDQRREETTDRLAVSVYRQAEALALAGDYLAASDRFERVVELVPGSEVGINAHFDAASHAMRGEDLVRANSLLREFRALYPAHELSRGIAATLVGNYEQAEQWALAAEELDSTARRETDLEARRQAQYLAATYYERAGDSFNAIKGYRSYAHVWEEPALVRVEAMNRLAELYQDQGDDSKRRFWLRKIVAAYKAGDTHAEQRSLYLAAAASSELAAEAFAAYSDIDLRFPLKQSLARKRTAMDKALASYRETHDLGVEQYTTQATYQMGLIYQGLVDALMDSQRPDKLDALALEQYELMLEEQAWPFEEKAVTIYESNVRRAWQGVYDDWVKASFRQLGELMPARYAKMETVIPYSGDIF